MMYCIPRIFPPGTTSARSVTVPESTGYDMCKKIGYEQRVTLCCHVSNSRPIEHSSTKRCRDRAEAILLHVCQEKLVLVCEPLVVSADFLYDAMGAHAERAFRVMIAQTPLVEAVVAHEMYAGQIEVSAAL
jgi:hypothetical protein